MGRSNDLVTRIFGIGKSEHTCAIVFIDGLVDKDLINDKILKNLQIRLTSLYKELPESKKELLNVLERDIISTTDVKKTDSLDDVMLAILSGDTVLFLEGTEEVLIIGTKGWASRSIEEPNTEALVRGPRAGFIENIRTNTMLIRRDIRDPNLRFDHYKVGKRSKKRSDCLLRGGHSPSGLSKGSKKKTVIHRYR